MYALVILYQGELPTRTELERAIDDMPFVRCATSVNTIDAANVAKLLVRSIKAPQLSNEEGNNAITVLAGLTDMNNDCIFVTQIFEGLKHHDEAIVRACSILAQGNPYSKDVANRYHFTEDKLRIIKQFHNEYNNG